jgi:carbonic anhydrase
MQWIAKGIEQFQHNVYPARRDLFEALANGQNPEVLFITCSDSRVDPNMITQAGPGELFHLRNAGNIVPTYSDGQGAEASTIEYALSALGIRNIVVCGHTDCGAMKALLHPEKVDGLPAVANWLKHAESARRIVASSDAYPDERSRVRALIEQNVLAQLLHLQTHPVVATRLAAGELSLFGWVYEIATGHVHAFNSDTRRFEPLRHDFSAVPGFFPQPRAEVAATQGD